MKDDFTDDIGRWLPDEGWIDLEVATMKEEVSKTGNPKYQIHFVSASDPTQGFEQSFTNIPGKRWLLRQLIEACGIEGQENSEGRKIYDWDTPDIEGRTVSAKIIHDKTPFIGRNGETIVIPKPKITEIKKVE